MMTITADASRVLGGRAFGHESADPRTQSESEESAASARPDQSISALVLIARLHHVAAEPAAVRHSLGLGDSDAVSRQELLLAARHLGLKAKLICSTGERLAVVPLPALAPMSDGRLVVIAQCDGRRVLFLDPSTSDAAFAGARPARPTIESMEVFAAHWAGELILITSRASLVGELAKFDFSWFIPAVVKHRKLLGEVLLISLFLQLFALVSPLFFQVVMDKVLVHRGTSTLDVIVIGLVVIVLFE